MTRQRLEARLLQWLKTILFQFGFWVIVNLVFTVIFTFGASEPTADNPSMDPAALYLPFLESLPWILFGSLLFSVFIGSTDFLEQIRPHSNHTFAFQVVRKFTFHLSGLVAGCLIPIFAWMIANRSGFSGGTFLFFLPRMGAIIFFAMIALIILSYIQQLARNIGRENMLRILLGTYHRPRTERWIFMFLDLKDSTGIAERLGHLPFATLIQELLFLLNGVSARYMAEIHKYVGDEAILCWEAGRGDAVRNSFDLFFAFQDELEAAREHFQSTYGTFPEFKAAIHMGEVTVAEVGDSKREIAFYGDVVNTTARIEGACTRLGHSLLVSQEAIDALKRDVGSSDTYAIEAFPKQELKGKVEPVSLYGVRLRESTGS